MPRYQVQVHHVVRTLVDVEANDLPAAEDAAVAYVENNLAPPSTLVHWSSVLDESTVVEDAYAWEHPGEKGTP